MLDIGEKLRAARTHRNLSLRELAAKAEVSASLLSQIENGKANPSVRSLHSIADALSLPVHYFFPNSDSDKQKIGSNSNMVVSNLTASQVRAARAAELIDEADLGFDSGNPLTQEPVVRDDARPTIELEGGVTWSRLTPGPEDEIEYLHICYDVGASSGKKMSHHAGREFHFILEGELLLELGFEHYLLKAGDSIIFDSTTPHRLLNAGKVPLRAVTVILNTK